MPYKTPPTPTTRKKLLGRKLKAARDAKGLSAKEAAVKLDQSEATIYRVEAGITPVRPPMVRVYAKVYGVTDRAEIRRWEEWARKAKQEGPWAASGDTVGPTYRDYADAEALASELRTWELGVIPGLLQTARVSEQVIRAGMLAEPGQPLVDPITVDEHIQLREERKRILKGEDAPLLWAVISEAAILTPPVEGDPAAHREQIQHLLNVGDMRACIQVLPLKSGMHAGLSGAFTIIMIDDVEMVFREGYGDGQFFDGEEQVRTYRTRYERLQSQALSITDTRRYLHNALDGV